MSDSPVSESKAAPKKTIVSKESMQKHLKNGVDLSKKGAQALVDVSLKGTELSRSISKALIDKHPQVSALLDVCLANSMIVCVISIVRLMLGMGTIVEFAMYNVPLVMFCVAAIHRAKEDKKKLAAQNVTPAQ